MPRLMIGSINSASVDDIDVQQPERVAELVHDRVAELAVVVRRVGIEIGFAGVDDHVAAVGEPGVGQRAARAVDERAADADVAAHAEHAARRLQRVPLSFGSYVNVIPPSSAPAVERLLEASETRAAAVRLPPPT